MMLGGQAFKTGRRPSYAFYSLLNMSNSAVDPFDSKLPGSAVGRFDLRSGLPVSLASREGSPGIGLLSSTQGSSCQRARAHRPVCQPMGSLRLDTRTIKIDRPRITETAVARTFPMCR